MALWVVLAWLAATPVAGGVDTELNLQRALTGIYDGHDADALRALAEIESARPGYPAPAVYRSLLAYWRASADPGNPELAAHFRQVSTEAIRLSEAWLGTHKDDAEAWRFVASALGQRSQFAIAVAPNTSEIVRYGMKAREAVMRAYELDESNKDILIGIGATNYFTANIPWYVKPMAFTMGIRGGNRELGLKQIEQGMNEGPHSKVEGAMVLAGAMYSEARYPEFYRLIKERITTVHPSLLPPAAWAVGGCLCGGMTEEAVKTVQQAAAGEDWRSLQMGRIALVTGNLKAAEEAFSRSIAASSGNRANLSWAYYGRSLARTRGGHSGEDDWKRAKETSVTAFGLAERQFQKPGGCKR